MTPLERSRGLGTRLAALLPIEGDQDDPSEGHGRGVRAIIPVKEGSLEAGDEGSGPVEPSRRPPENTATGRGLPGGESAPHVQSRERRGGGRRSRPTRLRRDQRIFVGLEILHSLLPVDLCAYVEQRGGRAPRVYMRANEGALRSPDEAFDVSASLETLIGSGQSGPSIVVGDLACLVVPTQRDGVRGMHVLGRRGGPLCHRDMVMAERFCRLLSPPARARR